MRVCPLNDLAAIEAYLDTHRLWSAYALGDLDPGYREKCEWFGAQDEGGSLRALALVYHGLEPPALLTMGDAHGIALILGAALRAPRLYVGVLDEHLPALRAHYRLGDHEPMWRMALRPDDFRPRRGAVTHLTPQYTRDLKELYALGGGDAFTPGQVFDGAFFGIEERGRLVAAAGTHVLSETRAAAAVGNVFTHPDYRGRGYAEITTSAVCADLIQRGIRTLVLNVAQSNAVAIHVYEKLGFKKIMPFVEGTAIRKRSN